MYELRCIECHDVSVHGRQNRVAKNYEEIRSWVIRWNNTLGALWDTPGQLAFFAEFLQTSGLFEHWLQSCPPALHQSQRTSGARCPGHLAAQRGRATHHPQPNQHHRALAHSRSRQPDQGHDRQCLCGCCAYSGCCAAVGRFAALVCAGTLHR